MPCSSPYASSSGLIAEPGVAWRSLPSEASTAPVWVSSTTAEACVPCITCASASFTGRACADAQLATNVTVPSVNRLINSRTTALSTRDVLLASVPHGRGEFTQYVDCLRPADAGIGHALA